MSNDLPLLGFSYDANDPDVLYRLGLHAALNGATENAAALFQRAVELDPSDPAKFNSWGNQLLALKRWNEARSAFSAGLKLAPNHVELLSNLALVHKVQNRLDEAQTCLDHALLQNPDFLPARDQRDFLYKDAVPTWHFSMMNDSQRNAAYEKAIQKAVRPDSVVLEIGTGSGLLAMMAARAGAKHVYTAEMNPLIAAVAQEIIQQNGYADRITVLAKKSTELQIGVDLPEPADVLVTETFDAGFLGEGAVPSIAHARGHLLKPDAQLIPCAGSVFANLLESQKLWEECAVSQVSGFDLSAFNRFQEHISVQYVERFPHRRLSRDTELFHFDFTGYPIQPEAKRVEIPVIADGVVHQILYWFRLFLDSETVLDTNIEDESCWRIALQILNPPLPVQAGSTQTLIAQHNTEFIKLRLAL
ncbi:MAG: tetratricopeptide repeat protein [Acidobacteria bacterium]|nr:tetratricopeptide repeat protein [Acidobacteriota bacterium]